MSYNYFAQAKESINKKLIPNYEKLGMFAATDFTKDLLKHSKNAVKFTLPINGKFIEDNLKGLDGSILKLPYPLILMEYAVQSQAPVKAGQVRSSKRIIIAEEIDNEIRVYSIHNKDLKNNKNKMEEWKAVLGYISVKQITNNITINSSSLFPNLVEGIELKVVRGVPNTTLYAKVSNLIHSDIIDEVMVLFNMLEALSCSNVNIVNEKRPNNQNISKPANLQNVYKVLSINSTKLSSSAKTTENVGEYTKESSKRRQHTRRGHIRNQRYKDCVQKIWINPVIVNPQTSGTVFKEYIVH